MAGLDARQKGLLIKAAFASGVLLLAVGGVAVARMDSPLVGTVLLLVGASELAAAFLFAKLGASRN